MQKQNTILILSGRDEHGAINSLCREKEAAFRLAGKNTCFLDLSVDNSGQALQDIIQNFEIEFVFSYLGFGADISWRLPNSEQVVNIWEHHNIPFIKLQSDLPSYFIQRHRGIPKTSINIYASPELAQVQTWYFQEQKTPHIINTPIIFNKQPLDKVNFSNRANGTLVFLKNGNDPKQLMTMWHSHLPTSMATDLCDIANALLPSLLNCEPVNIFGYIIDFVESKMGDALACRDLVRLYSAQLDDFFRRVKSTMLAASLKKFPVKIIGRNWEHINDGKSVATFSNDINFSEHSQQIFEHELGLIDMTPNYDLNVHDRFCRAVGNYAFILTNKTTWMEKHFPEFNDYTYIFDKAQFESKVDFLLSNKELVVEQGKQLGILANERINNLDFVNPLIQAAEKLKFMNQPEKPAMQSFYVW